jgi:hypothetical protein
MMIFADKRYKRAEFLDKIPAWIKHQLEDKHKDMSTDVAVWTAAEFFKEMGQPFTMADDLMLTVAKLD